MPELTSGLASGGKGGAPITLTEETVSAPDEMLDKPQSASARAGLGRIAISAALLCAILGYFVSQVPPAELAGLFGKVSLWELVIATVFLGVSQLLATIRLKYAARDLGHHLGYRDCLAATMFGSLAGAIAFQMVGQIAARGTVFRRGGSTVHAAAAVTFYERAIAAIVSVVLAVAGGLYLFGAIGIDPKTGGEQLAIAGLGLLLTLSVVVLFGWRDLVRDYIFPLINWRVAGQISRTVALTLIIQLCTLVATVAVIGQFAPQVTCWDLVAASTIVMFASSLPISFAGWGVRELSAVAALGLIGVAPQAALAGSISFGILSLATVVGLAALATLWLARDGVVQVVQARNVPAASRAALQGRAIEIALCLLTTAFALFQLQVPLARGWVNVSPADLLAVTIGILALFKIAEAYRHAPTILAFAIVGTAVVLLGYVHGLLAFGKSDWAGTRALGWFVLVCYAVAGARLASASDVGGDVRFAFTLSCAGVSVTLFSIMLAFLQYGPRRIEGFAGNPNALGFQLLICLAVVVAYRQKVRGWIPIAVVLAGGVLLSGSLACIATLLPLAITAIAFARRQAGRPMLRPILYLLAALLTISTLIDIYYLVTGVQLLKGLLPRSAGNVGASTIERVHTIVEAAKLFAAHPIVGAGLGYFYEHVTQSDGKPLVIHSTPLWILAEFGMVGFGVLATFLFTLVRNTLRGPIGEAGVLLCLIVVIFACVGAVHDIFYQRSFWLALGATIAVSGAMSARGVQRA